MKKISSVLLALIMIVSSVFIAPVAWADLITQTPSQTTTVLKLDGSWSDEVDHKHIINSEDWYSFHLDTQGKLKLKMKTDDYLDVKVFNSTDMKNEVLSKIIKDVNGASTIEIENKILVAGDYFVKVVGKGKYSLSATFGGNSYVNPQNIIIGKAVSGLSTVEEDGYWYQVNVPAENKYRISLVSYGNAQAVLYSQDRSKKYETVYVWGDNTVHVTTNKDITVSAGTYMIKVDTASEYALAFSLFTSDMCDHNFNASYVAPTYFADGYTLHTCTICGYSYKDSAKSKKKLKTPKIYTLKSGKKSFILSNSKNNDATGYQVKYSTSKKFTKKTTKTKKFTKSKNTVKGLKSNKKYFVKVRTYKKQNGKTVYSSWSKVKTVKTK